MKPYSWDGNAQLNDGTNFAAYFLGPELGLPEMQINMAARYGAHPLIGGVTRQGLELLMEIEVLEGSADTLRAWFDAEDETPKVLTVVDENGTNARYWKVLCASFAPTVSPYIYLAKLRVHGDVRLRSVAPTTVHWDVAATGATTTVTNGVAGVNDEAYPVITITPREYATGINPYRRFIAVAWRASESAIDYPVDITNDSLDTRTANTHFASAVGNDIRLYVDGVAKQCWLDGPNTTTTKIWCNLSWSPCQTATLAADISVTPLDALVVNEDISGWPPSGLILLSSEIMQYTGKVNATRTFTGVTRGVRGTTATSHFAADHYPMIWLQHEIWIEYGDATGSTAGPGDTEYSPVFDIATSTNTSWNYDDFAVTGVDVFSSDSIWLSFGGRWIFANSSATVDYSANQYTISEDGFYKELGVASNVAGTTKTALSGAWSLFNPCGITAANFQNGQFYHGKSLWWVGQVRSFASAWTTSYSIPASTSGAWNSWSQNITSLPANTRTLELRLAGYGSSVYPARVECSDVTLTFNSSNTPFIAISAEETTYRLQITLANETTGESLTISAALDLDEVLEIDVDNAAVTLLSDNTAANNTVAMVEGVRRWLLRLLPGANTLRYEEAGVEDVDVDISFERRYRV